MRRDFLSYKGHIVSLPPENKLMEFNCETCSQEKSVGGRWMDPNTKPQDTLCQRSSVGGLVSWFFKQIRIQKTEKKIKPFEDVHVHKENCFTSKSWGSKTTPIKLALQQLIPIFL